MYTLVKLDTNKYSIIYDDKRTITMCTIEDCWRLIQLYICDNDYCGMLNWNDFNGIYITEMFHDFSPSSYPEYFV